MSSRVAPMALRWTVAGSALLHTAFVGALVFGVSGSNRTRAGIQPVITTKLVRLGEQRPKNFLPRKDKSAPPKKAIAPTKTSKTPAPKPMDARERLKEISQLSNALSRLRGNKNNVVEGMANGSVYGEVTDLAQALIGNQYADEIKACAKANYVIEGIPPEKLKNRSARVFVRVAADGTFFDLHLEKGSGLPAFDRAVEGALRRCAKVSPPPKEISKQVQKDGVEFEFVP